MKKCKGRQLSWRWLHYPSILDTGHSILAGNGGGGPAPFIQRSVFLKDRRGLERVLRVEHSTAASTWWGGSPCAQVFLRLPLLALEGRLHHPDLSSVASSLERQFLLLK